MAEVFPEGIRSLPRAAIPLKGVNAYLSQSDSHQVIFMKFDEEVELTEHSHESQWAVVVEGKIDMIIDGVDHTFQKGDSYYIPRGVKHSGKIYAGYADVTFFNQKDRYEKLETEGIE